MQQTEGITPPNKGHCKHGEFDIREGCPQCVAERRAEAEVNSEANIAERIAAVQPKPNIVKVQYYSITSGETSPREYTYYSADQLKVGDIVTVPVRDTTTKAQVSAIDVPESEIASFKDSMKTIPAGSIVPKVRPEQEEMEAGLNSEGLTLASGEEPETAVALRPGEDVEAHGYFEEALKLLEYAEGRVIATVEDLKLANDDLSLISKLTKLMGDKRRALLGPLEAQKIAIRDTYNYLMAPVLEADKITRGKMLAYDAEQRRIRAEQERINALRLEAAQKEMELNGELSEPVNLVEVVREAPKRVSTDMGTTGMTDHWKYEVFDFALLPDEYKVADSAMLNTIAKKHHDQKQIPGVRFYNEPIITVRTK